MACRDAYKSAVYAQYEEAVEEEKIADTVKPITVEQEVEQLFFGVDSKTPATEILQNNLTEYEWVSRNKISPNFWGRYILGENALSKEEIAFLGSKGCLIAAICVHEGEKSTEEQGRLFAQQAIQAAVDLEIPVGKAIFLELVEEEAATAEFLVGFADELLTNGYLPGFRANTDAAFDFDHIFSQGMQTNPDVFGKCAVWACAPTIPAYDRITTTHLIHPDEWTPFAPSGITRKAVAVWQYSKECHPIQNIKEEGTSFNMNLVRNVQMILEKMF